jgi:hypothetical protein
LGFYCTHEYAHTNSTAGRRLPFALKGVDVAVYAVFGALGLSTIVRPILRKDYGFSYLEGKDIEKFGGSECDLVAEDFHGLVQSNYGGYDGEDSWNEHLDEEWPFNKVSNVLWINEPSHEEAAWVQPTVSLG